MSKDRKMRGFDSYDVIDETFTHDKPVEVNLFYPVAVLWVVLKILEYNLQFLSHTSMMP